MAIRYKAIEHERTEDAPFVGALISAIDCKFNCKGCFNRQLKKEPTLTASATDIINEVKANPFNEGIILGGLEWSLQLPELVELVQTASENDLKVMIYTGCDFDEFHEKLGKVYGENKLSDEFKQALAPQELTEVYGNVGKALMAYYIPQTYYIKTGLYDRTKAVDDYYQHGVKLASSNQLVYEIREEASDEHED